ncbi:uncharacterized protein A1O9_05120 [Exophiala aquamarina CBS 119918]|uniref:Pinin/SDK/MemA protein domain-containing protein n=1 Tax=Exophiala aquamarina CBS 119918 TaxID=1182545 RepID=A0A072PXH8_9EURO|nr:uncharacterized protein A1O9_05120 [Exophiala aquamarina CBS 119918]KEF60270.1 hypothetical protein A1O9_05120 [Exophiala aquamarina CBS 119918]
MISSAVVIPDEPEPSLPTTSLKRRQSERSKSPDSSKRPRLDSHSWTISSNHNGARSPSSPRAARNASSPTSTTSAVAVGGQAMSPPRRRATANNSDEKSRNRRLFGALLGNLAQPAASSRTKSSPAITATAARRREDIESRQRQRLQRENEEISEHARRKREELNRTRKVEQRRWDEEAIRTRHTNMSAMAEFLRTDTEPMLYYKPWEMRAQEEETVRRQKDEVEETINREWEAWERKKRQQQQQEKTAVVAGTPGDRQRDDGAVVQSGSTNGTMESRRGLRSEDVPMNGGVDGPANALPQAQNRAPSPASTREDAKDSSHSPARSRTEAKGAGGPGSDRPQSSKDDDHGGEELELGQEDDVIY